MSISLIFILMYILFNLFHLQAESNSVLNFINTTADGPLYDWSWLGCTDEATEGEWLCRTSNETVNLMSFESTFESEYVCLFTLSSPWKAAHCV